MSADIVERVIAAFILLQEDARPFDVDWKRRQTLRCAQRDYGWIRPGRLITDEL